VTEFATILPTKLPEDDANCLRAFVTAHLLQEMPSLHFKNRRLSFSDRRKLLRLFLISIGLRTKHKTNNRKRATTQNIFTHNGTDLPINVTAKSGCYVEMLKPFAEQLTVAYSSWKRVLVYRFDLHLPLYTPTNEQLSGFIRALRVWIKRNYNSELGYVWAREQERSKAQHYHLGVFINGNKIRHPKKLREKIVQLWSDNGKGYSVPTIPKPFYFVEDDFQLADAYYRLSYLAKERGKGYRPEKTKDFSTSRRK
jgi:hypothetical protein